VSTLAVIPARGGSKGIRDKNLQLLAGLPLIGHALELARRCPGISRTIVSTDSEQIAELARGLGGDVPFLRPPELATDETAMWPVLRHALDQVDPEGTRFDRLLLLAPTSPFRLPGDVAAIEALLDERTDADGVVSVSDPGFNPIWVAVVERDGLMTQLVEGGEAYVRRQDLPPVHRINGALYLWRSEFVRREPESWFNGRNAIYEMPRSRVADIDEPFDLAVCELLLESGLVRLPWVEARR
jgi:N-acylneuraminate cytidylyltransferase